MGIFLAGLRPLSSIGKYAVPKPPLVVSCLPRSGNSTGARLARKYPKFGCLGEGLIVHEKRGVCVLLRDKKSRDFEKKRVSERAEVLYNTQL